MFHKMINPAFDSKNIKQSMSTRTQHTPLNVSRRNSFGGRDFSDKENETKAPKGSKNFMSPTISAVSKINPSPRKRVLSDKNQVSRFLSDVKRLTFEGDTKRHHQSCVSFSDVIHIISTDEKEKQFERPHDMTVTDFDESEEDKGITSPEFADREVVGPLLPPYDPKKNYLSPRPQFLHYRPNPSVEKHLDERKQLEELFISESSSSDTELSAEESVKCEKQDKDGSHEGGTKAVVEEESENVEQLKAESDEEVVCESTEETSQVPKQSGFRPFRFFGWFLAMSLGYLLVSASFSGPTGLSVLKESPLYQFHIPNGIKEFAEANKLEELSEKLWTLTESSLVYMDKMISRLGGGTEEYALLQFHNLTYSLEENTVFQPTRVEINGEPLHEKVRGENSFEDDYELEEESGEIEDGGAESNEVDERTEMPPGTDIELKEGEAFAIEEPEVILPEVNNDAEGLESQESLETGSTKKEQDEIEAESEAIYINQNDVKTHAMKGHQQKETLLADAECESEDGLAPESSDDLHPEFQHSNVDDAESEPVDGFSGIAAETSDDLHPKLQQSEVVDAESESGEVAAETSDDDLHPEVRSFNKAITVLLSSTVLVLLAAVAFSFARKAKHVAEPAPETEEINLTHEPVENLVKEKLSSLNIQAKEEVDDRISNSVHKKSTSLSNNKDPKEHQSLGGNSKLRRESLASSASEYSVGSFSYGSFTTYEKIPIKSGDGEEEMITPLEVHEKNRAVIKHKETSSVNNSSAPSTTTEETAVTIMGEATETTTLDHSFRTGPHQTTGTWSTHRGSSTLPTGTPSRK
ncbi:hypothetical protein Bca4012_058652 [Brassica carinata]